MSLFLVSVAPKWVFHVFYAVLDCSSCGYQSCSLYLQSKLYMNIFTRMSELLVELKQLIGILPILAKMKTTI